MRSVILSCVLPAAIAIAAPLGLVEKALGAEPDKQFFHSVEGRWVGPGEIIAGKYKNTKFTCDFIGSTPASQLGMTLDGGCRVGVFTQKMSASVERKGRDGYRGTFMGGSTESGMDIVGGNVV